MEKFGIFELLDTLSALTEGQKPSADPAPPEAAAPQKDEAFAPPAYPVPPKGHSGADALQGFLARHEAVARKADKKS